MAEPLSLAEAKAHLRVSAGDDDALIEGLIVAAREFVEHDTGLILTAREVVQVVDRFGPWIDLHASPVRSITSVVYLDADGEEQTLPASKYAVSLQRRPVRLATLSAWPTVLSAPGAITVTIEAGYASADDVPRGLKQAMLLLIGHWYDQRAGVSVSAPASALPLAVDSLCRPHRPMSV